MKAYVVTTAVVFGLLTAAHIWRVIEEGTGVARLPFVLITIAAATLCLWGCRLALRTTPSFNPHSVGHR
jgi:hypothetical protein